MNVTNKPRKILSVKKFEVFETTIHLAVFVFPILFISMLANIFGEKIVNEYMNSIKTIVVAFVISLSLYSFIKRYLNSQKKLQMTKHPGNFSLFVAGVFSNPTERDSALGCIEERFRKDVEKRGYRWAKYMLWRDNLVSFWTVLGDKIIKVLRWAGLGYLIEKLLLR